MYLLRMYVMPVEHTKVVTLQELLMTVWGIVIAIGLEGSVLRICKPTMKKESVVLKGTIKYTWKLKKEARTDKLLV